MTVTVADLTARFWTKVTVAPGTDCWQWTGALNSRGYGQWAVNGTSKSCHRLTYQAFIAEIPSGLVTDHLCRNRACCNPWHLELVTTAENNRRGKALVTHCPRGHAYTSENTLRNSAGNRHCRECQNARRRVPA